MNTKVGLVTKGWLVLALLPLGLGIFSGCQGGSSGLQQTCANTGDCKDGRLCVNQVCIQNEYPVDATAKECVVIECAVTADCCEDFEAPEGIGCEECAADPTLPECPALENICTCQQECTEDGECVNVQPDCTDDLDCFGGTCDTTTGECVECLTTDDCDTDETCVDGVCDSGCTTNEDCPLFHACGEDGLCTETGCTTPRECILFTGRADSECDTTTGQCRIPCEENAECGELNVCQDGTCVFLGCETDEECRSYLGVDDDYPNPDALAKCVPMVPGE